MSWGLEPPPNPPKSSFSTMAPLSAAPPVLPVSPPVVGVVWSPLPERPAASEVAAAVGAVLWVLPLSEEPLPLVLPPLSEPWHAERSMERSSRAVRITE